MKIDDMIKKFDKTLSINKINGGSLICIDNEYSIIHNYGTRNKNSYNKKINNSTIFQIGSITKVFTALMTIEAMNRSILKISTTVGDIVTNIPLDDSLKKITILELLTHTSGLPRLPDNFDRYIRNVNDPYCFYGKSQLIEFLTHSKIIESKKLFGYSNLGYGLLGFLLEIVTTKTYNELLSQSITTPLNIQNTGSLIKENSISNNVAKGYNSIGDETPMWDMNILQGAGGIISTPQDIQVFLASILGKDSEINKILEISFQSLNSLMSYGWFKKLVPPLSINFWHNGMTGGFSSYIELNKKNRLGLAVLLNKAIDHKLTSELANVFFYN